MKIRRSVIEERYQRSVERWAQAGRKIRHRINSNEFILSAAKDLVRSSLSRCRRSSLRSE